MNKENCCTCKEIDIHSKVDNSAENSMSLDMSNYKTEDLIMKSSSDYSIKSTLEKKYHDLIIFLDTAETYRFQHVHNLTYISDTRSLEFDYYGKSTSMLRHAVFNEFVGYALSNTDN